MRGAPRGDRGGLVEPEVDDARPCEFRGVAPHLRMRIVGVDHRRPARWKRTDGVGVLGGDLVDRAHEFLVLALRIGDHADRRPRDRGELAGLAAMVHPDLEHGEPLRIAQAQHRERQADRVVEIARGRGDRVGTGARPEHRRDHLLGRRLAVAADDHRDRNVEAAAPVRGQRAECGQRLVDGDQVAGKTRCPVARDQRRGRAAGEGLGDEIVAVETLAAQRDEQVAGYDAARVGGHARKDHRRTDETSGHRAGRRRRIHHARLRRASAASATPRSENGRRWPFTSW